MQKTTWNKHNWKKTLIFRDEGSMSEHFKPVETDGMLWPLWIGHPLLSTFPYQIVCFLKMNLGYALALEWILLLFFINLLIYLFF